MQRRHMMAQVVQYERFGDSQVLQMAEVPDPTPGPGEVRIAVKAVGLNPLEQKVFRGDKRLRLLETVQHLIHLSRWFGGEPAFPRGVARDFSGFVDRIGPGVTGIAMGDAVLGTLRGAPGQGDRRGSLADTLVVSTDDVVPKPTAMNFETAATIGVAAQTVCGAFRALNVQADDVIIIANASGGVGSLAVQLAVHRGARVIGIASQRNSDYLRSLGAVPVAYGDGIEQRIRDAAPASVTKLLDCHLGEYIKLGFTLGLPGKAIGSLEPKPSAIIRGAHFTGSHHAEPGDLAEVAALVADGTITIAIERTYPFDIASIRRAYTELAKGHVRGKLVVQVD